MKFNIAIERFVEWGSRNYSPRTLEVYVDHLRRFGKYIEDKDIEKIKLFDDILKYSQDLQGRGIADNTINLSMISLRQLWKVFVSLERELKIVLPFIWEAIPIKKGIIARSHRPITAKEHLEILNSINGLESFMQARDTSIILTLYHTGMRVSELTSLNVTSVDTVDQSLKVITRKRRDKSKFRQIFFPRELAIVLQTYIDMRKVYTGEEALFVSLQDGKRLSVRTIERTIKKYCLKAGMDPTIFKPHCYRHGWGMRAAEAQMYPPHLQANLGHTTLEGSKTYFNLTNSALREEYHLKMGDKMLKAVKN